MAQPKQQAIFPDLPRDNRVIDERGNLTAAWALFFHQLVMALQTNIKPEGIVVPPKPTSDIIQLVDISSNNNIIYDNTTNEFKGRIFDTMSATWMWKVFTLT